MTVNFIEYDLDNSHSLEQVVELINDYYQGEEIHFGHHGLVGSSEYAAAYYAAQACDPSEYSDENSEAGRELDAHLEILIQAGAKFDDSAFEYACELMDARIEREREEQA